MRPRPASHLRIAVAAAVLATAVVGVAPAHAGSASARSQGKIAYVHRGLDLRAVTADGSVDTSIAPVRNRGDSPTWSPDGRRFAYHHDDPHALTVVTLGRATARVLFRAGDIDEAPAAPDWSPTGRELCFTSSVRIPDTGGNIGLRRDGLFVIGAGGGAPREVPVGTDGIYSPSWSHDGRRIAFLGTTGDTPAVIAVDIATGTVKRLFDVADPTVGSSTWSPDGRWFAFIRSSRAGAGPSASRIWVVRSDGTGARQVTSKAGIQPAWSPDGRQLAFTGISRRSRDIYKVRLDGSGLRRLTRTGRADQPDWGPGTLPRRRRP